jgi:allene oxide cyclase-like protein
MQKKRRLGTVLVFLLAVAVITVAPASSSGSGSGDDDRFQVIRVTAVTVQEAGVDLGETGDSLGDQFIFSDDLFKHGKKVGIDGGVCTLVRLVPMVSATLQCVATAELPKGQITAQALLTFLGEDEQPQSNVWAITGGTGKYKEAGGVLKAVDVSETESQLTFKITD